MVRKARRSLAALALSASPTRRAVHLSSLAQSEGDGSGDALYVVYGSRRSSSLTRFDEGELD